MEIAINKNSKILQQEIQWFISILDTRMKLYFENDCTYKSIEEVPPPEYKTGASHFSKFIEEHKLRQEERIALILALTPHLSPQVLDVFFTRNASYDRAFSEFGGAKGKNFNGFIPSGETLLFILAGKEIKKRIHLEHFLLKHSVLLKMNVLKIATVEAGEPLMSGLLSINPEYLSLFTIGEAVRPDTNPNFPARLIQTNLSWDDLVLEKHVRSEVEEIKTWVRWNKELKKDNKLRSLLKPGYRTLFYGPPGTGKTLTASLLGKITGKDVYKIDLSMVVSKYIGETEKNLAAVFDMAENKNCILFFDEADALFGKRTATTSSNDRYANQEIAYLLQRIEDFPGLIILATNLKLNLDEAFARRFQSMIHFPMPGEEERILLWENAFIHYAKIEEPLELHKIAKKYALSGGAINNVVLYCLLQKENTGASVDEHTILEGIKRELRKEGKTI